MNLVQICIVAHYGMRHRPYERDISSCGSATYSLPSSVEQKILQDGRPKAVAPCYRTGTLKSAQKLTDCVMLAIPAKNS